MKRIKKWLVSAAVVPVLMLNGCPEAQSLVELVKEILGIGSQAA